MTDSQIIAGMSLYGIGPRDITRACSSARYLESFKRSVKARYRELAKECHPDRGGDEELFKVVTAIREDIEALEPVSADTRRRVKWAIRIRMEDRNA